MVTDTTAQRLARDLIATRELLSVALELLAANQQHLQARERAIVALRQDIGRLMQQVQA